MPAAELWPKTIALVPAIEKLKPSPFRWDLSEKIRGLAVSRQPDRHSLEQVCGLVADSLSGEIESKRNPLDAGSAETWLVDLVHLEGIQVKVDTSGYRAADQAFTKAAQRRGSLRFELPDLDGRKWSLASLHGKVVLVNYWWIGCVPCRAEMPTLNRLLGRYKPSDFQIVSLAPDDPARLREFVADHPIHFPILLDPGQKVFNEFSFASAPRTLIFDRESRMVGETNRDMSEDEFVGLIEKAGLKANP